MSNYQGSRNSSIQPSISSKILKFAEYTSIAVSVVGSIASATSQQVLYAAAPLTISLALNLANRQRFEAQTQRRITAVITQVEEGLNRVDRQNVRLQQQVKAELNQHLARFEEQLSAVTLSQADFTSLAAEFEARLPQLTQQLTDEIQGIQQQLQSQPERPSLASLQVVEQALDHLRERIAVLESQTRQLQLQQSVPETAAIDGIRQSIQQLFDRLRDLEALVSNPPPPPPPPKEELHLNLGIDFGTSFTKVCFRDIARDHSEVVTFSESTTQLDEALLPTKIGILSDGTLIAGLTESEWKGYESQVETTVELIKMRLAALDLQQGNDGWRLEKLPELDRPELVENLCAYYLSRVINRTQHWIRRNKSELLINHRIEWSANVGVPVAYCDSLALARFEKVLSLAWLLSNEPQTEWFTLENLAKQMNELRSRLDSDPAIDCFAIPEIAAEAWSFFNSREADDGVYIFFDIGDGTLDGTAFYYFREEGEPKVNFYAAVVEPLGVTALSQQLAHELKMMSQDVKATLCKGSLDVAGIQTSQTRKRIQQLVASVIVEGKGEHFKHFPRGLRAGTVKPDFQDPLKVFLGGGGSKTEFYRQTITSTHTEFKHQSSGIPPYSLKSLPTPKDLTLNQLSQSEFHRFAVAYGLSLSIYEGAKVCLPSQVGRDRPRRGEIHYSWLRDKCTDMKELC